MRNRGGIDIMAEILHAANEKSGAGRTKILYRAFLSYAQLKEYLPALTERGLLSYDIDAQTFKTTQKGRRFLNTYNQINDAIKTISPPPPPRPQQKQV
jgi:predicted transcriptional regulator